MISFEIFSRPLCWLIIFYLSLFLLLLLLLFFSFSLSFSCSNMPWETKRNRNMSESVAIVFVWGKRDERKPLDGDLFSWLEFLIILCWYLNICICVNYRSKYWFLNLSWLGMSLFLGYSLLSRFSESVGWVLPLLLRCLVCIFKRDCFLRLKAGRGHEKKEIILAMHKET